MDYKICTFNVNGLGEHKKRRQVFEWLKTNKYDICFLQELHCQDFLKDKWAQEFVFKVKLILIRKYLPVSLIPEY